MKTVVSKHYTSVLFYFIFYIMMFINTGVCDAQPSIVIDAVFQTLRDYAQEFPDGYRMHGGHYSAFHLLIAEDVEVLLNQH